ncbi:MAG TPA: DUF3035 domain-containing protein [Parvularculaceae bacterium]|nr:DUF3035 domain-containing protein [Amphiplicatus sp.]MCB9955708.1 DUF3035 domain-containing protein [Caulobacterales bacterium]HOP19108.1 DUF3035 domain-containing protein [Amphiplicatus sp.]HPE29877.1 DUF3035 domain-containing protein [Parvularculaceae bacterium]HRX40127.1 DUF3035 domain-containing protein [Parvularculaceae bacterium]
MKASVFLRTALGLAILAAATSGCAGFGRAVGGGKNPPDEFAVTTKAPLVVPPDYSLRPPKPGEARPEDIAPSERARQVLLGDESSAPPTAGEQYILYKANALNANPNIRNLLNAENGGRAEKERSLANQLIFWKFVDGKVDDSVAPLRVDNPDEWWAERQESIDKAIGKGQKVTIKNEGALGLPGIF